MFWVGYDFFFPNLLIKTKQVNAVESEIGVVCVTTQGIATKLWSMFARLCWEIKEVGGNKELHTFNL